MKCRKLCTCYLMMVLIIPSLCPTAAGQAPTLQSATFFGGAGDQRAAAAAVLNNQIYVSGSGVIGGYWSGAILVRYSIPPGVPPGSTTLPTHTYFSALAATPESVYAAGNARPLTCGATDNVGSTEDKSVLALFDADDGSLVNCQSPKIFPSYDGGETFYAVQTLMESGSPMIYAAGGAETCGWGMASFVLYKYDGNGGFINRASEPGASWEQCVGHSNAFGIATLNGYIYLVGRREPSPPWPAYDDYYPFVMKYDPTLALQWNVTSSDTPGEFTATTELGGYIYAVGATGTFLSPAGRNYLIEKYDESSNRVWRQTPGTAGEDVLTGIVAVGDRLFAVGYTKGEGSGGADMVILEIDPGTGAALSTTYYGGLLDDFARGATTDGVDLYVAGESRSSASVEGNSVGENDMVLLRYSIVPPNEPPLANAGPDKNLIVMELAEFDGSGSSDSGGSIAGYQWNFGDGTPGEGWLASHTYLQAGTYIVTLTVADDQGATATDTAQVVVHEVAYAIDSLSELVASYNLKQGIANSLDSKLQNVLDALSAANAGQRQDVTNKLEAFINSVEAQRAKELTNAQADALEALAKRILGVL